jgi:hypothetical protein
VRCDPNESALPGQGQGLRPRYLHGALSCQSEKRQGRRALGLGTRPATQVTPASPAPTRPTPFSRETDPAERSTENAVAPEEALRCLIRRAPAPRWSKPRQGSWRKRLRVGTLELRRP